MIKNLKTILLFMLFIVFNFQVFSQTKLDIKTSFKDKADAIGIKYGVIHWLKQTGYKIVEFGEKYSVWITDLKEEKTAFNKYKLDLTISICKPTLLLKPSSLKKKRMFMVYVHKPKLLDVDKTGFIKFIKEKVENIKKKEIVKALIIGLKVSMEINKMLNRKSKNKKPKKIIKKSYLETI